MKVVYLLDVTAKEWWGTFGGGNFLETELIFLEIFLSYDRIVSFFLFYNRAASCHICHLIKHTVAIPNFYSKCVLGKCLCGETDDDNQLIVFRGKYEK